MTQRSCAVMGILNVTPDSFSDGGRFVAIDGAVEHAKRMLTQGADLIDVGGESTRPGAVDVDVDTECQRVIPSIKAVLEYNPSARISVDTTKSRVADAAVCSGAVLINDISAGLLDPDIFAVAADHHVDLCLMHMQGTPRTMQVAPHYDDVVADVQRFLDARIEAAMCAGVELSRIIIDPGIGFGKTVEHNLQLLRHIADFRSAGVRILLGVSRKSVLGSITGRPLEERLASSLAIVAWAAENRVDFVRVHDVAETVDVLKVWKAIRG